MKNKSILLAIAVLLIGLSLAGGTYAYLTMTASVTNGNYNTQTTCFNIDYNINNEGSGQDITGTLFPSSGPSGGLSGRVGLKTNSSCSTNGIGTLKLHINTTTSPNLMTSASSNCQNRKTLEPISGITTESACTTAGGRWRGYGDAYCESNATLERLTAPTDSESCTSAGGTWKTGGSPLKYAVYDNNAGTGVPLSKGYIESTDINTDKVIYDNFVIDTNQKYYYIFIWIDGYLVDNAINNLPFSGKINASALQTNEKNIKYVYTANIYKNSSSPVVTIGSAIPDTITQYNTPEDAISELIAGGVGTSDFSFFLKHTVENDIVIESYVGYKITSEVVSNTTGAVAGTYYLRGGVNESSLASQDVYNSNMLTANSSFGSDNCDNNTCYGYSVNVPYIESVVQSSGVVSVHDFVLGCDGDCISARSQCVIESDGTSICKKNQ